MSERGAVAAVRTVLRTLACLGFLRGRLEIEQLREMGKVIVVRELGRAGESYTNWSLLQVRPVQGLHHRCNLRIGNLDGCTPANERDLPDVLAIYACGGANESEHDPGRAAPRHRLDMNCGHWDILHLCFLAIIQPRRALSFFGSFSH